MSRALLARLCGVTIVATGAHTPRDRSALGVGAP